MLEQLQKIKDIVGLSDNVYLSIQIEKLENEIELEIHKTKMNYGH